MRIWPCNIRQQNETSRAEVNVPRLEICLIYGREIIESSKQTTALWSELHDAIAVGVRASPVAVARGEKDVACRVGSGATASHPDATQGAVGRNIENRFSRKSASIVGNYPPVILAEVAVRSPTDHDVRAARVALKQQGRALAVNQGIEIQNSSTASAADSRNAALNVHGSAKFFIAGK